MYKFCITEEYLMKVKNILIKLTMFCLAAFVLSCGAVMLFAGQPQKHASAATAAQLKTTIENYALGLGLAAAVDGNTVGIGRISCLFRSVALYSSFR